MKNSRITIAIIISFVATVASSFYLGVRLSSRIIRPNDVELDTEETRETRVRGYKFISPLLECQPFKHPTRRSILELKAEIQKYIEAQKWEGKASTIAVYYRDLNNGPWIGINQDEAFSPASLLKVPIMMAVFKREELQKGYLEKKINYIKHTDDYTKPNIEEPNLVKVGNTYTVMELVEKMIIYSDNEAKQLLLLDMDEMILERVYSDLGVKFKEKDNPYDILSVTDYSAFFRILYNASYLNYELSEKALELLSQTHYAEGLRAGVPTNILLAHKYGERGFRDSDIKQLHDCGIVYLKDRPYLLCVMTRGTNFDEQAKLIAYISQRFYEVLSIAKK